MIFNIGKKGKKKNIEKRKKSKCTEVQEPVPFAATDVAVYAGLAEGVLTPVAANEIPALAAPTTILLLFILSNFYRPRLKEFQALLYNIWNEPYLEIVNILK